MKKLKKTYRVLAITALMAMMANVLLPASAAAARYICSTEYVTHQGATNHLADCCLKPGQTDTIGLHKQNKAANHTEQSCSIREIFEHALATELSKTPVILPNTQHTLAVLPPLTMLQTPFMSYERDYLIDTATSFSSPPIFLMNNSFLN